jgi:nitroreductase
MHFDRPVTEAIRARMSVRTYSPVAIEPVKLDLLQQACASVGKAPFGETARFRVLDRPFERDAPVKVSNYGLQRNPRYFFAGAITASDTALEGYGYLLEHLVLRATELGLGTCWMGYFNREFFADFPVAEDELFPATCVVGVPAKRPRLQDKMIRSAIKADARRDWRELFFRGAFGTPLSKTEAGKYAEPLEMLRLAPSSGNTQPWRVVKEEGADVLHVYLKKVKQSYYNAGMHNIDVGIAMSHLELTAREMGLDGKWGCSDPGLGRVPEGTEYRVTWTAK